MIKKVIGWTCIVGAVGVVIAFVILAATGQISQWTTYLRIVFVPPIVFGYGLHLVKEGRRESPRPEA